MEGVLKRVQIDLHRVGFSIDSNIKGSIDISLVITCFFFWVVALFFLKYSLQTFLHIFCSTISSSHAKLPNEKWKQKPGEMGDWGEKTINKASMNELEHFLEFRHITPKTDPQGRVSRKELEKLATVEAVNYRSECVDFGSRTYDHEVHTKGNNAYPRFVPPPPWNGWQGFWAEMGNYGQNMFSGNLAYAFEHALVGVLAAYFLFFENVFAYKLAMYLDMGFNLVDLLLMSLSLVIQKDVTFYSGFGNIFGTHGTFKLLLLHHLGAFALEYIVLVVGDTMDFAYVACHLMIALVGTTGMLHFVCVTSRFTPLRENIPVSFCLYAVMLGCMLWYRVVYWVVLVWQCLRLAFAAGWVVGFVALLAFALFSLFNYSLTRHYIKVTKTLYGLLIHSHKQ